ncbi:DMT family transporter [Longirhabdus pacifica]|uniref:DMT family transporter n=1 Tax=Longirhabdus pacifica TaxID=2305227 RepID=UPI001008F211|nr:DMT family transporter [Longirhabdus pacifica]
MKNGIILAIASAFTFSIMNVLVKAASETIPVTEIVFFRSLIGTLLVLILMRKYQVAFSKKGIPMLFLRGALGSAYLLAYFYTIAHIPLGDASILAHMSPFFALIFSIVFLKESVSKQVFLWMPLFLVGAVFLLDPSSFDSYTVYALVGVLSAMLAAGAATSIRYLSRTHHKFEIVFYFLATGTVVSIPLMWEGFVNPSWTGWIYLISIGIVSLIGQFVLTSAFTHENVMVVEVVRYIGIFFNVMWGFLFWGEVISLGSLFGGACIIAGSIALSRRKKERTETKVA